MAKKTAKRDYTAEQQFQKGPVDLPFAMLTLMLLGVGLIMVFSASYASAYYDSSITSPFYYIKRQAILAVCGVFLMGFISTWNYQEFRKLSIPAIIVSVILLILVQTPLGVTINDARRWVNLGVTQFQPSELAKISIILFFATRLSQRESRKPLRWKNRTFTGRMLNRLEKIGFLELLPYGIVLLVVVGLVIIQPHMSGTILILVGAASVLFVSGISAWWFIAGGGAVAGALYFIMTQTAYMQTRLSLWANPFDPNLDGYQIQQSLIAIGSGGLLGLGLGQSMQKILYVPEPENDFIFAIVVEELGFVGACIVIGLFVLLILRGYWLAIKARDRFGTLTIVGIITLLAVQVFLNIAVVTNTIPTTGIPLPFFSYGGTALLIQLAEMGIVLSISRQIPAQKQD